MKAKLPSLLRIAASLILLVVLVANVGAGSIYEVLRRGDPIYLLAAFAVYLLGLGVRAYRWQILLSAQRAHLSLRRLTSLYFVGAFFSTFLPTGVGGDVIRMMELAHDGVDTARSVSTVLADRISGLLVLFAISLISLPFSHQLATPQVTAAIIGLSLTGLGIAALLTHHPALDGLARRLPPLAWLLGRERIRPLYETLAHYRKRAVAQAILASLLFNGLLILTNILIARALLVDVHTGYFLLFVPLISFLLALPLSMSGLGIREGGYVYLFGQAGVPAPVALSMSLSFYAIGVATGLIGGIIYAMEGLRGLRNSPQDEE